MPLYRPPSIAPSEITPQSLYLRRREVVGALGLAAAASAFSAGSANAAAITASKSAYDPGEPLTPKDVATTYNNFYEFGTGKEDPSKNAGSFKPVPWSIQIDGLVAKPKTVTLEEMMALPQEERVYRMRCVEAWSMVLPWTGFPLAALLSQVEPTSDAKYVAFETVVRPEEMPGQGGLFNSLDWPYVEGLRLDEAMHPLTILATGLYGETLPNQNGAPVRLVVPWKYGFKGIKSIVRITLTDKEPPTTWNLLAPQEYGFYANVNPAVDHPRWSQATERRITGGGFFSNDERRPTLPFNGYADEVASLYSGMDLVKNY